MSLSPEQQAAAERSGQDACCVAGPGSGKTRVLVARFEWLVRQGFDPQEILAITFTEKATRQLKTRLTEAFRNDDTKRRAVERSSVYTIDGFGHSLLRTYALRAGLDPQFRVLDEREARLESLAAIETVLDRFAIDQPARFRDLLLSWDSLVDKMPGALLNQYEKLRAVGGVAAALSVPIHLPDLDLELRSFSAYFEQTLASCPPPKSPAQARALAALGSWFRSRDQVALPQWLDSFTANKGSFRAPHPLNSGIDEFRTQIEGLKQNLVTLANQAQRQSLADLLLDYETEFRRRKRAIAGLDFGDLTELSRDLLKSHRDILKAVRERYRHILMDELQDTSPVQWELVNLVRGDNNFFAVGDINQSIYGFRQAEPRIFTEFRDAIAAQGVVDRLTRNYRSEPAILEVVNRVIPECPGVEPHTLLHRVEPPATPGPAVELICLQGEDDDDATEAHWVASRVRELIDESGGKLPLSDIAVLARAAKTFDALEEAFARFSIPCLVKRGKNFFEELEIIDLTNWLRVLDNPENVIALVGLLRSPFFSLTDEDIYARRLDNRLLLDFIAAARRLRAELPIDQILARLIDNTGYLQTLLPGARANVAKFLQILRQLQQQHPEGLPAWIDAIDQLRSDGREPNALVPDAAEAVEILTVHTAKGLEWPIVVVTAMAKTAGGFPEPLSWSPNHGLGARWQSPLDSVDRQYAAASVETDEREDREEDRLLYVAMTRAEQKLILVWRDAKTVGPWAAAVRNALQPAWPEIPFKWETRGPYRLMRVEGMPDVPGDPPALRSQVPPPETLAPLALQLQSPPSVSVTALAHFHDCPRRHLLANILLWPVPVHSNGGGTAASEGSMALGTEVHELLAGLRETAEASPIALDFLARFRSSELGRRAAHAPRSEREFDFLIEIEGTLLQGAIDLWFEDERGLVLVDYKSDQHWNDDRERDYGTQLRLYALALARHTGRPVTEAWLFRLRDSTAIPIDLSGDLGLSLITQYQQDTRAGLYPTRPAPRCSYCPFAHNACPDAP